MQALLEREIGYFVYIGGNDSMDTVQQALRLHPQCSNIQGAVGLMGAAQNHRQRPAGDRPLPRLWLGGKVYRRHSSRRLCSGLPRCTTSPSVTIVEVMGRNAGWLTAAATLSRENGGTGPQLIYLCERAFDTERFLQDVQDCLKKRNAVVVAVSEGVKNPDGSYLSESKGRGVDVFGHAALSGTAKVLEGLVKERIGCKVRSIELNLMQRCASHLASANDLRESRMLGMTAADPCYQRYQRTDGGCSARQRRTVSRSLQHRRHR